MNKIEYEIILSQSGRPSINLSKTHEDIPEDKFFVLEMTRYILENVYSRRSSEFDPESAEKLNQTITVLQQVGDEIAEILWHNMKALGDASMLFNNAYHFQVKSIDDRNRLSFNGILIDDKLYLREIGLKVLVTDEMKIYMLKDGIENENWEEINGSNSQENGM